MAVGSGWCRVHLNGDGRLASIKNHADADPRSGPNEPSDAKMDRELPPERLIRREIAHDDFYGDLHPQERNRGAREIANSQANQEAEDGDSGVVVDRHMASLDLRRPPEASRPGVWRVLNLWG